jgi:hypothetical protein
MRYVWIFLTIVAVLIFINNRQLPFQLTKDMAVSNNFEKRPRLDTHESFKYSIVRYDGGSEKLLFKVNTTQLTGFRCSDYFLRFAQGIYALENIETKDGFLRSVKNKEFINFMIAKDKKFPVGKKILSARVCETENRTLLLFYSIGTFNSKQADIDPIRTLIFRSTDNEAFVHVLSKNPLARREFRLGVSDHRLRCEDPFQIENERYLYILCGDHYEKTVSDFYANYFVNRVDLVNGKIETLRTCRNTYFKKLKTVCN